MTVDEARSLLATGNGTPAQLAEANRVYYSNYAASVQAQPIQQVRPVTVEESPATATAFESQSGYNSSQYATESAARQIASYLGGTIVKTDNMGNPIGPPEQWLVQMPNGSQFNAGLLIATYAQNPKSLADQMVQDWMNQSGERWQAPVVSNPFTPTPAVVKSGPALVPTPLASVQGGNQATTPTGKLPKVTATNPVDTPSNTSTTSAGYLPSWLLQEVSIVGYQVPTWLLVLAGVGALILLRKEHS